MEEKFASTNVPRQNLLRQIRQVEMAVRIKARFKNYYIILNRLLKLFYLTGCCDLEINEP